MVVTYHESSKFAVSDSNGFRVYFFKSVYTKTFLDKIIRWIVFPFYIIYIFKKEKIDILHCHSVSALSFVAGLVAKILGLPRVIKFAGDWVWETLSTDGVKAKDFREIYNYSAYSRFLTWVEKKGLKLFDTVWVVSNFRKQNVTFLLGSDEKIVLIPNCLLLSGGGPRSWSPSDPVVIISANRFIPHKRLPFMVELFAELNITNSKLVLIGGGNPKEISLVTEAIKKHKIEDKVELLGILTFEELYQRFSKASFYLSTSLEEGFPNVYIEAMHYGLPVITADDGGSKELVVDSESGFVINSYDKDGYLEKMRLLATDINLRNKMSEEAFKRSELFNLELRIADFIKMYKELLK